MTTISQGSFRSFCPENSNGAGIAKAYSSHADCGAFDRLAQKLGCRPGTSDTSFDGPRNHDLLDGSTECTLFPSFHQDENTVPALDLMHPNVAADVRQSMSGV